MANYEYKYEMEMKDGKIWRVSEFDGGGMMINGDSYEVFFYDHHDKLRCVKQNDIISVHHRGTEDVFDDFGNKFIGQHPYAEVTK
jgi:hypothetical protein